MSATTLEREWLTKREATAVYGLSAKSLDRLARRGEVETSKPLARRVLFSRASLDALMKRSVLAAPTTD